MYYTIVVAEVKELFPMLKYKHYKNMAFKERSGRADGY